MRTIENARSTSYPVHKSDLKMAVVLTSALALTGCTTLIDGLANADKKAADIAAHSEAKKREKTPTFKEICTASKDRVAQALGLAATELSTCDSAATDVASNADDVGTWTQSNGTTYLAYANTDIQEGLSTYDTFRHAPGVTESPIGTHDNFQFWSATRYDQMKVDVIVRVGESNLGVHVVFPSPEASAQSGPGLVQNLLGSLTDELYIRP